MTDEDVAELPTDEQDSAEAEPEDFRAQLKKVLDVQVEDVGVLRKKLTICVPADTVERETGEQYKELSADSVIPGFRRGRAPQRLVEKRFGREVGSQVLTKLVSNAYLAAIDKESVSVLGEPLVWAAIKDKKAPDSEARTQLVEMQTALEHLRLPESGDFEFACEVEVKPDLELPDLKGIPVERHMMVITDEDVTAEIDRVRARRGNWAPVLDGTVAIDDLLVCEMKMTVDSEEIKTAENIQIAARPQRVEGVAIEDLGDKLKGCSAGDTKVFKGVLPDDYDREELRGKEAEFAFKIEDIKRLQLPPLDAAYLDGMGFDSEKEYRAWVRETAERHLDRQVRNAMQRQIAEHLVKAVHLDLPEGLSTRQTDRAVHRRMMELRRQGVPQDEIEKHGDELRTTARQQAIGELKLHFILEQVAEELDVDVTEEEINGQIAAIAQQYGQRFDRVRDELGRDNGLESLYLQIRDEKCLNKVLLMAEITDAQVEAKPTKKKAQSKKKTKTATTASARKPAKNVTKKKAPRAKAPGK